MGLTAYGLFLRMEVESGSISKSKTEFLILKVLRVWQRSAQVRKCQYLMCVRFCDHSRMFG